MIPPTQILKAFIALSDALKNIPELILSKAKQHNPWFDNESVTQAANAWAAQLTAEKINSWLANYSFTTKPLNIAIIMAGNIPLVGLHDLLCVLGSGNKALIKLSSDDKILMTYCIEVLNSELENKIEIIDRVNNADAIIATGSNNSAKIFESYFSKFPNIIRKNRTAIAVLTGNETKEDLELLGNDIFNYYGLGCRNISKIFVPQDYDFALFFEGIFSFGNIINHHKYANNYDYNKAIYLLGNEKFLDNNFLIVRRDEKSLHSPLAVMFYDYYETITEIKNLLNTFDPEIQCVASKINLNFERQVGLGETQNPGLLDYADGIDTMQFLNSLK